MCNGRAFICLVLKVCKNKLGKTEQITLYLQLVENATTELHCVMLEIKDCHFQILHRF